MNFFRKAVLVFLLAQTACGFSPIYGDHAHSAPVADEMNQVTIANIPDRSGQILRNDLIDRMYGKGRPHSPRYTLSVKLQSSVQDVGIQADATSTRSLMNTMADYVLTDTNNKEILKGTAHSVTSYNRLENQYGSEVAHGDAVDRTLNEVSEQIVNRISLYFAERAETNSAQIISTGSSSPAPNQFPK